VVRGASSQDYQPRAATVKRTRRGVSASTDTNRNSDVPRVAGHKATAEELKRLRHTLDAWLR
jgi:hypothetical protein